MTAPRVPTSADVDALVDACPRRSAGGSRDRAMVLTIADAGMRPLELLSVMPNDLDLGGDDPQVRTLIAKRRARGDSLDVLGRRLAKLSAPERARLALVARWTKRGELGVLDRLELRWRQIGSAAANALEDWMAHRKTILGRRRGLNVPVFTTVRGSSDRLAAHDGREPSPTSAGSPMTPDGLRKTFQSRSRQAGLARSITARDLRHFAACREFESSRDILSAQNVLAHASPTTTQAYLDGLGAIHRKQRRALLEQPLTATTGAPDELEDLQRRLDSLDARTVFALRELLKGRE